MGVLDHMDQKDKNAIAFFASYGLVCALIEPRDARHFADAYKAVFDPGSIELKQLAALLGKKTEFVQNKLLDALRAAGFPCDSEKKN